MHGRVKFRVGQIVWLAFSRTRPCWVRLPEGVARSARRDREPDKFQLPGESDLRFNWAEVRLDAIEWEELRDLMIDAWSMVVPKYVSAPYAERDS